MKTTAAVKMLSNATRGLTLEISGQQVEHNVLRHVSNLRHVKTGTITGIITAQQIAQPAIRFVNYVYIGARLCENLCVMVHTSPKGFVSLVCKQRDTYTWNTCMYSSQGVSHIEPCPLLCRHSSCLKLRQVTNDVRSSRSRSGSFVTLYKRSYSLRLSVARIDIMPVAY